MHVAVNDSKLDVGLSTKCSSCNKVQYEFVFFKKVNKYLITAQVFPSVQILQLDVAHIENKIKKVFFF